MAKCLSSLLSAMTLSAVFTAAQQGIAEYYPIWYVFIQGTLVLSAFYLFAGIPLSVAADRMAYRSRHRFVARTVLYFLFGCGLCLVFLLVRLWLLHIGPGGHAFRLVVLFGASGVVFAIYEYVMERLLHASRRMTGGV